MTILIQSSMSSNVNAISPPRSIDLVTQDEVYCSADEVLGRHSCTIRGRVRRIALIIAMRHIAVMTQWRPMSRNTNGDSFKWCVEMPMTEMLVTMSPRKRIKRRSGISDVSDAGLAGGAMVALRVE